MKRTNRFARGVLAAVLAGGLLASACDDSPGGRSIADGTTLPPGGDSGAVGYADTGPVAEDDAEPPSPTDGSPPPDDAAPPTPTDGSPPVPADAGKPIVVNPNDGLSPQEIKVIVDSVVPDGKYKADPKHCTGPVDDQRGTFKKVTGRTGYTIKSPPRCLIGGKARGAWSVNATWSQIKSKNWGDDGITWSRHGSVGLVEVRGTYVDNLADPIAPPKNPATSRKMIWHVSHVYGRHTRDDFVENDACLDGKIDNTLVDGAYNFISARPGAGNSVNYKATHDVSNSLIRLECASDPRTGSKNKDSCPAGQSTGRLFKWSSCGGSVNIQDSIIVVDARSQTGTKPMGFPPGKHKNVWLIYLGPEGKYPQPLPTGVTQVGGKQALPLWDAARARWLQNHGCDLKGDHCTMTDK